MKKKGKRLLSLIMSFILIICMTTTGFAASGMKINKTKLTIYSGQSYTLTVTGNSEPVTWSSSNTKILTVSKSGKLTGKKAGNAIITAKTSTETKTCKVTVKKPSISKKKVYLEVGSKTTLKLYGTSIKSVSSRDKSIARIGKKGVLTAKNPGNTIVTITGKNGKNYKCRVIVNGLSKQEVTLKEGEKIKLKLYGTKIKAVSSSMKSIVTVNKKGVLTAKKAGKAIVTFRGENGIRYRCTVNVDSVLIPVTDVSFDKSSLNIIEGETLKLLVTVTPENATNKEVVFASSDEDIVTVSADGTIIARKSGSADITATAADGSGVSTVCKITVLSQNPETVPVSEVILNRNTLSLTEGETAKLSVTVTPENATNKEVIFTSSNNNIVTVSADGTVTAKRTGSANITATAADGSGVSAVCKITVSTQTPPAIPTQTPPVIPTQTPPVVPTQFPSVVPVSEISLDRNTLSLAEGGTAKLSVTVTPENATNKEVIFTSSDDNIVTVSADGTVMARTIGSADITATAADGSGVSAVCNVEVLYRAELDTDKDGLSDELEKVYGTNINDPDTDGDGLTDGQEVLMMGTDPLMPIDKNQDTDNDGLTDEQEGSVYGTDAYSADTDGDTLTDYDEIFVHKTSPVLADTDGDGLTDDFELSHGLNPLIASSNGEVQDSDVRFLQNITSETGGMSSLLSSSDNATPPLLSGEISGNITEKIYLSVPSDSAFEGNRFIIGKPVQLDVKNHEDISGMNLSFDLSRYGGNKSELCIVRLNEDGLFEIMESTAEDNKISCTALTEGSYCVINISEFLAVLDIDVDSINNRTMTVNTEGSFISDYSLENDPHANDIIRPRNKQKETDMTNEMLSNNIQDESNTSDIILPEDGEEEEIKEEVLQATDSVSLDENVIETSNEIPLENYDISSTNDIPNDIAGYDMGVDFVDGIDGDTTNEASSLETDNFAIGMGAESNAPIFSSGDEYIEESGSDNKPSTIDESETDTEWEILESLKAEIDQELLARLNDENEELLSSEVTGQADIAFVIDTTGSMGSPINNVVTNVVSFAENLRDNYNVRINYSLIDFKDLTVDGLDSTQIVKNDISNWFYDANAFIEKVKAIEVEGGGDEPECSIDALETARRLDFRPSASKFIILITDAGYKTANNFGLQTLQEEVDLLKKDGIITSVVSRSYLQDDYRLVYEECGGIFADIYSDFSSVLLKLANLIGEETSDGEWVILKHGMRYVKMEEIPSHEDGADMDGDGLSDFKELGSPVSIELTPFIEAYLKIKGIPASEYKGKTSLTVYDAVSDPTQKDTDFDGIDDGEDTAPWQKGLKDGVIGELTLVSCYDSEDAGWTSGHAFFVYKSYVNDKLDFNGLATGWNRKDSANSWSLSNIQRDYSSTSDYKIKAGESVSIGNGALDGGFWSGGGDWSGSSGSVDDSSGSGGGSSDDSSGGGGEANGVCYNMEVYKHFAVGYSYLKNTCITETVTESSFEELIDYLSKKSVNYWSLLHNCATVACDAWNKTFSQKVSPYSKDFMLGSVATPKGLKTNLRKIPGHFEDYVLANAF